MLPSGLAVKATERFEWLNDAACFGLDSESFFPEDGDYSIAKRVCKNCPVKKECLSHALDNRESGVWGGTSERERSKMITRIRSTRKMYDLNIVRA
jgi:WhiB family transcriptional regulator, redox-sensing transcriptional regulator